MELGYHEIVDHLLRAAAKKHKIPADLLKATAWKESNWQQFDSKGNTITGKKGEMGMMQINPEELERRRVIQGKSKEEIEEEKERLKKDQLYNIEVGAQWAGQEYEAARKIFEGDDIIKGAYSGYNGGRPDIRRFQQKKDSRDIGFWKIYNDKPWEDAISDERRRRGYWER